MSPSEAYHKSLFSATKRALPFRVSEARPCRVSLPIYRHRLLDPRSRMFLRSPQFCREPVRNVLV